MPDDIEHDRPDDRPVQAIDLVLAQPWAILPEWLEMISKIALRQGDGAEAVAAKLGRPLDNTYRATVRDGVAIIPMTGPIFPRANLFTALSGAVSVQTTALDFRKALDDDAVEAIVLNFDSPGGNVTGINEFGNMIYEARGRKPLVAYVNGMGASAAYWLASAADQIVLDGTASVGSIGVVAAMRDTSARDDKAGVKNIEIVSSQSPNKRLDVSTDDGRARIQAHVDRLAQVFVETVARNRSVKAEHVLKDFGRGGVMVGSDAVDAGMADRIGSLEQVIAEFSAQNRKRVITMAAENEKPTETADQVPLTLEAVKKDHPAIAEALRGEGAEAERTRIQGVLAQSAPGCEELVQSLAFDGKTTGPEAAVQVLAKLREQGTDALAQIAQNTPDPVPPSVSNSDENADEPGASEATAVVSSAVAAINARRGRRG